MQTAILLWKNKKKKYAVRNRILPESSLEEYMEQGGLSGACEDEKTPEQQMLDQAEIEEVQAVVAALPEKYRMPVYLNFPRNDHAGDCGMLTYPVKYRKNPDAQSKSIVKRTIGGDRI